MFGFKIASVDLISARGLLLPPCTKYDGKVMFPVCSPGWGRGYPSLWFQVPSLSLSHVLSEGFPVSGPSSFPRERVYPSQVLGQGYPLSPPPSQNQDRERKWKGEGLPLVRY